MNNESYMTSEDTTSMLVDRFASREDIDPRFQTLSVPPFPRPLPPSLLSLPSSLPGNNS